LQTELKIIYQGKRALIYVPDWGRYPKILEEIEKQYPFDYDQLEELFEFFCNEDDIRDPSKFRPEGDKIYTFKTGNVRLYGFFLDGHVPKAFVITNWFKKGSKKVQQQEKDNSTKRRKEILKNLGVE